MLHPQQESVNLTRYWRSHTSGGECGCNLGEQMSFSSVPLATAAARRIQDATNNKSEVLRARGSSRRGLILGLAAFTGALATPSLIIGRSTKGLRRLRMVNHRTAEMLDIVYWLNGDYIEESLHLINYFMRDIREDKSMPMDKRNINNLAATQLLLESSEPFTLISGYRTQKTNSFLARRSKNVARNSLHVRGMAADIQMKNRSVAKIASAAKHCMSGGVGQYSSDNFVHIDCGRTRAW